MYGMIPIIQMNHSLPIPITFPHEKGGRIFHEKSLTPEDVRLS
jgi:hypothetical protein